MSSSKGAGAQRRQRKRRATRALRAIAAQIVDGVVPTSIGFGPLNALVEFGLVRREVRTADVYLLTEEGRASMEHRGDPAAAERSDAQENRV